MAEFAPAYKIIRDHEGYFANIPGDKGKRTYAGITEAYNPTWSGWIIINQYESTLGRPLRTNEQVPNVENSVYLFYKAWWDRLALYNIKDQAIANFIFDFVVNSSSTGVLYTEQVLQNIFKAPLKADRTFDAATIAAINAADPAKLLRELVTARENLYKVLAAQVTTYVAVAGDTLQIVAQKYGEKLSDLSRWNPGLSELAAGVKVTLKTQEKFLSGWLSRLRSFKTTSPTVIGGVVIVVLALIFFLIAIKN